MWQYFLIFCKILYKIKKFNFLKKFSKKLKFLKKFVNKQFIKIPFQKILAPFSLNVENAIIFVYIFYTL